VSTRAGSHANIIVCPVFVSALLVCAALSLRYTSNGWPKVDVCTTITEGWHDVRHANDIVWVHKPHGIFIVQQETNAGEVFVLEARRVPVVVTKSPDPQKEHDVFGVVPVHNIDMEDTHNVSKPIGPFGLLERAEDHDVGMGAQVDQVLAMPKVIQSVVDPHDLVCVHCCNGIAKRRHSLGVTSSSFLRRQLRRW
jgi:hypothetical protein